MHQIKKIYDFNYTHTHIYFFCILSKYYCIMSSIEVIFLLLSFEMCEQRNNDRLSVNPLGCNSKADMSHIYDVHVTMHH